MDKIFRGSEDYFHNTSKILGGVIILLVSVASVYYAVNKDNVNTQEIVQPDEKVIALPHFSPLSVLSLEEVMSSRRSSREYTQEPLDINEVSRLLWAAQGVTNTKTGYRTAPSAGATYPLEIFVVVGNVQNLASGVYQYDPGSHSLVWKAGGDLRSQLSTAALNQKWMNEASIMLVITAVFERTTAKYGDRGERYVYIEAGHAAQNVLLEAVSLDLGATPVGGFQEERVKEALRLNENLVPIMIVPVGHAGSIE